MGSYGERRERLLRNFIECIRVVTAHAALLLLPWRVKVTKFPSMARCSADGVLTRAR